jgi:hypothetical protein
MSCAKAAIIRPRAWDAMGLVPGWQNGSPKAAVVFTARIKPAG